MKIAGVLILLLSASGLAADTHFLGQQSDSDGNRLRWTATTAEIVTTPSWDGQGAMPFDLSRLLEVGRDYLKKKHRLSGELPVDGIWIQSVDRTRRNPQVADKWFVTVRFAGEASPFFENSVRILTDGTIIPPEEAEKSGP